MADHPLRHLATAAVQESLDAVHALLDDLFAALPDVGTRDRLAFTTAVAEVAANIVEHAARGRPVPLRLVLHAPPGRLEALFEDHGEPFDEAGSAPRDPADELLGLPESGRGLGMARALVEDVRYERDGPVNRWLVSARLTPT